MMFLAKMGTPTLDAMRMFVPERERVIRTIYSRPCFQPPVLDEMMPDITRLIQSVAMRYSDQTTPQLAVDEMVGQGRLKLSELLTKDVLERQPTREHFFRLFKTSLCNQARSLVQRYRFTEKRTGIKPPPRESRQYTIKAEDDEHEPMAHETVPVIREHHKNVELSLNDEELNLQVPDEGDREQEYSECVDEYAALLSDVEALVYRSLLYPGSVACYLAEHDARRGKPFCKVNVRIRNEHRAKSLGLSSAEFEKLVLSIRQKISRYRNMSGDEQLQMARRNAIIAQLKEIFGLQIPPNTDDMLVRRIITIAARDQYQKVYENNDKNLQIAELLEAVGAKVPRVQANNTISCYGVLYQRNNRVCMRCDLRKACSVEAANVGLGKIVLSPRLLGTRQTRVPAVLPKMPNEPIAVAQPEEMDWMTYLDETFTKNKKREGNYYCFPASEDPNRSPLFFVNSHPPLRLRFINPTETLKSRLIQIKRSWYAPERAAVVDVQELIDQHAADQLKRAKQYA